MRDAGGNSRLRSPPEPLRSALAACRPHFLYAALFSALVNLLFLTPTFYMLQVYDRVLPTGGMVTLVWMSVIALIAYLVLGALSEMRGRIMVRASLRLERLLAPEVVERTLAGRKITDPARQRALRDFDAFRQMVTGPGLAALFDAPWTPIYILAAFLLHPAIGVLTALSSIVLIGVAVLNERATKDVLQRSAEAMVQAQASQEAAQRRADVVRALGMGRALGKRQLASRAVGIEIQADASFKAGAYSNVLKVLRLILQSAVLGLAVWLAVERQISAGAIIAASLLMGRALAPIDQLVAAWSGVLQGRAAYERLVSLFIDAPSEPERHQLPAPAGDLRVQGLTVIQPPDRAILSQVAFDLKAGELLCILGPSGSGKTTLLAALAGARDFQSGMVRLDGASMADWDQERLAPFIGYLPQDSALFAGTIRDNISRFAAEMDESRDVIDARVVEAAKRAGAHEMILGLPGAYDGVLDLGGRGLSAGQAQRIALARALYGEPVLLLLDEPNAHLDGDGELALMEALKAAKARGAAIVLAAHRTSVLSLAEKVMVLRGGRVEMFGPTKETMARLQAMAPGNVRAVGS
jgi:PrtD family type I secretion system ABC transporter